MNQLSIDIKESESALRWGADLSPCRRYRYKLWRHWASAFSAPVVNFIMLNPSTADETVDDATIRRCIGFAKLWGYGGLVVTNLFAFRATDPKRMMAAADPVGPNNDTVILAAAKSTACVVCAWGAHGEFQDRAERVSAMLIHAGIGLYSLGTTESGQALHPLRLGYTQPLQPYRFYDRKDFKTD